MIWASLLDRCRVRLLWRWLFLDYYYARLRRIDEEILWPQILAHAEGDTLRAAAALQYHAHQDPPWLDLGVDRIDAEIYRISGVRTAPGEVVLRFRE